MHASLSVVYLLKEKHACLSECVTLVISVYNKQYYVYNKQY